MKIGYRASVASLLLMVGTIMPVQAAIVKPIPEPAPQLSPVDEGADAIYVFAPGHDPVQTKAAILAADRASREWVLNKNEQVEVAKAKLALEAQTSHHGVEIDGVITTGSKTQSKNSFTGQNTANGAVLVAYVGNDISWCTFTISGYCHAGIWNRAQYNGHDTDRAIRTANRGDNPGVKDERPADWQHYAHVREMKVLGLNDQQKAAAVTKALTYAGPYTIDTWKWDNDLWYCSKVVYRAYWDADHKDLDGDGGIWVMPGDIRWSPFTWTVKVWA